MREPRGLHISRQLESPLSHPRLKQGEDRTGQDLGGGGVIPETSTSDPISSSLLISQGPVLSRFLEIVSYLNDAQRELQVKHCPTKQINESNKSAVLFS